MDYGIDIQDNKKYIYVISYYSSSNNLINTDISIFEINEWVNVLFFAILYADLIIVFCSSSGHSLYLGCLEQKILNSFSNINRFFQFILFFIDSKLSSKVNKVSLFS